MVYKRVITVFVDVEVEPGTLVSLKEAARILEVDISTVSHAVSGDRFETVIIDDEAPLSKGRRFLLRSEVETLATERLLRAAEGGSGD